MKQWIALLVLGLSALFAAEPQNAPPPAPVVTEKIIQGTIYPFENYVGSLKYATLSKLPSESAASVQSIEVNAGDQVKKGQTLAVLDSAILTANIAAKAAELKRSDAQRAQAKKDEERYRTLYEQNSVSEQQFEQYRLKAVELSAQSEALNAQLEAMRIEKEKRTLKAPYDGAVIERHVSVGDWVATGSTVVTLAKEDSIELIAYLPAKTVELVSAGKNVTVVTAERELPAKIAAVSPRGDSASRTFPVRVLFDNPPPFLMEGMEATFRIPGVSPQTALLVSRDAVINRFGQNVVFFVSEGKAVMAPAEIVGYDGLKAAVRSPQLQPGMAIVIKGNERIFPGQAVKPSPAGQ